VLQIARELQRQVNGMKGFRAELTRTGDYFIPLRGAVPKSLARRARILFVSIARRRRAIGRCVRCLGVCPV